MPKTRPLLLSLAATSLVVVTATRAGAPPGDLDPTFDGDGKVTTDFGNIEIAYGVTTQADGKIVAAGHAYVPEAGRLVGIVDFAVSRYHPNGSLDSTINGTGTVTTAFDDASDDYGLALALQPDQKVVVAGSASRSGAIDFALARYNPDGSLDSGFGINGRVTTDIADGSSEEAWGVAIQQDGKIVAAGSTNLGGIGHIALARYHQDGSLDSTFDGDGRVVTPFSPNGGTTFDVAVQHDSKSWS